MAKIKTITLGCRFNFYESEVSKAMIDILHPNDDVIVINTCSVTHEAERQSKQAVRKAIRENQNSKIIVTGCAAKTASSYFQSLDGVFKVIQNDKKEELDSYLDIPHSANNITFDSDSVIEESDQLFKNKARVFLQIQNGCDHFCTYCIVPFTRGRSQSLPLETILNRVGHFVQLGFKEIVLSGIDITSYGKELENIDFSDVIISILNKYPTLERLRISSIDPKGIDDKLFDLLTNESRIMPHFHLSIQAGDNDVLKAMRRRHTREDVIKICNRILEKRPEVVFGSDLIAGFPTETDQMFKNTLNLIDEAHLSLMHVFPYSPRSGTIAASMIQLPRTMILERARILREKANEAKEKLLKLLIGKKVSGMVENSKNGISFGKTNSFIPFSISENLRPTTIVKNAIVQGFKDDLLMIS